MKHFMLSYYIFTFIIVTLLGSLFISSSTAIYSSIVYIFGFVVILLFSQKKIEVINYIKLYSIIFFLGTIYIYTAYLYKESKSYDFLLNFDSYEYFIPVLQAYIDGNTLFKSVREILSNFQFFSRFQSGYFIYLLPFSFLANYLNTPLDIATQTSSLLIGGFSSVIIYKLMIVNNITKNKAYLYALIICIFSILFTYSTQTLRDIHVMFLYLIGIYLTYHPTFTFKNTFKILLIILMSCTLRIETGLFLFVLIPIYLLNTTQNSKHKMKALAFGSLTLIAVVSFIIKNIDTISNILSKNSDYYLETDKGSGLVGAFQKLPVLGDILSILFNALQPLPFWTRLTPPKGYNFPEIYNILNFPRIFASFFNWIVICYILYYFFHYKKPSNISSKIPKLLRYHLIVGFIYLYIQSSVIAQRRLMAYYVMFYIFFYIIYSNMYKDNRNNLMIFSFIGYLFLQLLASFYLA